MSARGDEQTLSQSNTQTECPSVQSHHPLKDASKDQPEDEPSAANAPVDKDGGNTRSIREANPGDLQVKTGLFRTHASLPGAEDAIPGGALVFVGREENNGDFFVVRPTENRQNQWFWGAPVVSLKGHTDWHTRLLRLPAEGFYVLPEALSIAGGGRWLKNAIVQLGYNPQGQGILFVAERQSHGDPRRPNVLSFSERGVGIDDGLLFRLIWAPILPVKGANPTDNQAAGLQKPPTSGLN